MPESIKTEPLMYHGRAMTSDFTMRRFGPAREPQPLAWVRARLLEGTHQAGSLEPGDATRYDLVLTPIYEGGWRGLVVTRMRGGDVVATAALWNWEENASEHDIQQAGAILGAGNDWSAALFVWWLTLLREGK